MAKKKIVLEPVDPLLMHIQEINMNPYLLGIAYITLNLGGRFISMSMTPGQEAFLQHSIIRPVLLFAIMFLGTRNLIVAFWLSLFILLCMQYFFNENSSWYVFAT